LSFHHHLHTTGIEAELFDATSLITINFLFATSFHTLTLDRLHELSHKRCHTYLVRRSLRAFWWQLHKYWIRKFCITLANVLHNRFFSCAFNLHIVGVFVWLSLRVDRSRIDLFTICLISIGYLFLQFHRFILTLAFSFTLSLSSFSFFFESFELYKFVGISHSEHLHFM
jgi:hypothetical protein